MILPHMIISRVYGPCLLLVVASGPLPAEGPAAGGSAGEETRAEESTARKALLDSLLGDGPLASDASDSSMMDKPSADEAPTKDADSADDKPAVSIANPPARGDQQLTDFERAAGLLRQKLGQAESRLAAGKLGSHVQAAQADAIAATERLIKLLRQQKATSSAQTHSGDAGGRAASQAAGESDANQTSSPEQPGGAANQSSMAGTAQPNGEGASSARSGSVGDPASLYSAFRQRIIAHSWGHLPGQIQQRLRSGGTDKSLPRYENLVNRYFNSLVRPESQPMEDQSPK